MPACCPPPVCVHYWVSAQPGPPSGVQVSSRPVSSRPVSGYLAPSSGRGCPAGWCPARPASSRLVSSASGVQPSGVRPSARSQPSRPASAGWWRWGRSRYGGQRSRLDRVEFQVVRSRPRRLGRRPEEAWMRAPLRRWCAGWRGSAGRGPGPGGASAGGCTQPTRQARPPRGAPVAGHCAGAGSWLARCCRTAPCGGGHLAWSHDYFAWSLRSLTSEWTGPEGSNELGGEDGARPRQVASATGSTPATRAMVETCG